MQLRIEPRVAATNAHSLCADGIRVSATSVALFGLVAQALQDGLSCSELHLLVDGGSPSASRELEWQWIDNGWDHAYWLHVAPMATAQDADDPHGTSRDSAVAYMLEQSPLPMRLALPAPGSTRRVTCGTSTSEEHDQTFETLLNLLAGRRTRRYFRSSSVSTAQLLRVLIAATEIVRTNRSFEQVRPRPRDVLRSFGCWLEVGVIVFQVEDLEPGLYRFDISGGALELLRADVLREKVSQLLWHQPAPLTAAYSVVMFVDFAQAQWRYRHQRALRNVFIELGRIGQSLINAGLREGCGSFCTPAIYESAFAELFGIDPMQLYPAYTITQGT